MDEQNQNKDILIDTIIGEQKGIITGHKRMYYLSISLQILILLFLMFYSCYHIKLRHKNKTEFLSTFKNSSLTEDSKNNIAIQFSNTHIANDYIPYLFFILAFIILYNYGRYHSQQILRKESYILSFKRISIAIELTKSAADNKIIQSLLNDVFQNN